MKSSRQFHVGGGKIDEMRASAELLLRSSSRKPEPLKRKADGDPAGEDDDDESKMDLESVTTTGTMRKTRNILHYHSDESGEEVNTEPTFFLVPAETAGVLEGY